MNKTDRKPGVKLVTDYPVRREPLFTIRITETEAAALESIRRRGAGNTTHEFAALDRIVDKVARAREPRNVNL